MASINELKDVLKETLEERGVLTQLRAKIRAEIFNSLNDNPQDKPQLSMENMIINDLIREYLDYNRYDHTNSVFTPEAGMPNEMLDRNFISKKLKIVEDNNSKQMPLLYGLVFGMKKVINQDRDTQPEPSQQKYRNVFPESGQVVDQNNEFEFQDSNFLDDLEDEEDVQQVQEIEVEQQQEQTSKILQDQQFQQNFQKMTQYSLTEINIYDETIDASHEEYHLILKSNEYASIIEKEILFVHRSLKDVYQKRFPELDQIIVNPHDYVKIVLLIKNSIELSKIDFSHILNGHQVVAVNVAASSSSGQPLSEEDWNKVNQICQDVLILEEYHQKLLSYIESRMRCIAPNLSALVGTQVASQIMASAGGIEKLANMPACNIQVMGSLKKNMLGFSRAMYDRNQGYFSALDIVQKAPQKVQKQLVRMLATNVAKAARIDNLKTCPKGSAGDELKMKMMQRYSKIQEPPPAKLNKPLAIPDDNKKKKRGGKRYRKLKERMAQSEINKYKNRLKFGTDAEEEIRDTGIGLGMLSQGIGKVKMHTKKEQKIGLSKRLQQKLKIMQPKQSGGATGGLTSSIAFTPTQGIELVNPEQGYLSKTPDQYFNKESGFRTVVQNTKQQQGINILK